MSYLAAFFLTLSRTLNRAAVFGTVNAISGINDANASGCSLDNMPALANKNFRFVQRAARLTDETGYYIQLNDLRTLDAFGFYQQGGQWLAYVQATDAASFFRPICTPADLPIGQFGETSFERAGNEFIAKFNGVERWRETRDTFTIAAFTNLNIGYRGGGGGGGSVAGHIDYLYLEVQEPQGWVRYVDFQFNDPDNLRLNTGTLGVNLLTQGPLDSIIIS